MHDDSNANAALVGADVATWQQLNDRYTPRIRVWLRYFDVPPHEIDDVVQEVLSVVARKLPGFRPTNQTGAFLAWLRKITYNCVRDYRRASRNRPRPIGGGELEDLVDPHVGSRDGVASRFERDHQRHMLARLVDRIRPRFANTTWQAFERVAVDGVRPRDVAVELGISPNAVSIAKSRVLACLRHERKRMERTT